MIHALRISLRRAHRPHLAPSPDHLWISRHQSWLKPTVRLYATKEPTPIKSPLNRLGHLRRAARLEHAMQYSGYNYDQWVSFQRECKAALDDALSHLPYDEIPAWSHLPADVRTELRTRVNTALSKEDIPECNVHLFYWSAVSRLANIRDMAKARKARLKEAEKGDSEQEGDRQ